MKGKHWKCPNCGIVCAIEVNTSVENMVVCVCNHSMGKCYYCETVTDTIAKLNDLEKETNNGNN